MWRGIYQERDVGHFLSSLWSNWILFLLRCDKHVWTQGYGNQQHAILETFPPLFFKGSAYFINFLFFKYRWKVLISVYKDKFSKDWVCILNKCVDIKFMWKVNKGLDIGFGALDNCIDCLNLERLTANIICQKEFCFFI